MNLFSKFILGAFQSGVGGGGGGGAMISIADHYIKKLGTGVATVVASVTYKTTGITQANGSGTLETWLVSGVNTNYAIRATSISGTPDSGTMGTWQTMSADMIWNLNIPVGSALGDVTATFLIEIRDVATSTVQDSATITLDGNNT